MKKVIAEIVILGLLLAQPGSIGWNAFAVSFAKNKGQSTTPRYKSRTSNQRPQLSIGRRFSSSDFLLQSPSSLPQNRLSFPQQREAHELRETNPGSLQLDNGPGRAHFESEPQTSLELERGCCDSAKLSSHCRWAANSSNSHRAKASCSFSESRETSVKAFSNKLVNPLSFQMAIITYNYYNTQNGE